MVDTWASTVFAEIDRCSATDRFERPSATRAMTWRSRVVSTESRSWVERGSAGGHPLCSRQQLGRIGDAVLEEVADATGPAGEEPEGVLRLEELREDQDPDGTAVHLADADGGLQPRCV